VSFPPTVPTERLTAMQNNARSMRPALPPFTSFDKLKMTLAKKGTRKIVVDGMVFRWTVLPDDEPGVALVAELHTSPVSRAVTWFPHGVLISPAAVTAELPAALASGWNPRQPGPSPVRQAFSCGG